MTISFSDVDGGKAVIYYLVGAEIILIQFSEELSNYFNHSKQSPIQNLLSCAIYSGHRRRKFILHVHWCVHVQLQASH